MLTNERFGLLSRTWHPPTEVKILNHFYPVLGWNHRDGAAVHQSISEILRPSYIGGWLYCCFMSFADEVAIFFDIELLKCWPRLNKNPLSLLLFGPRNYPAMMSAKEGGFYETEFIG
tara:strand:- start:3367 stop:3717 length:351 start_codon:yes stop_codon:yes gene_type:complete